MRAIAVFLLLVIALSLSAQFPAHLSNPALGTYITTTPGFVPASTTAVSTKNVVWADLITLTNTTGAAVTVTISDRSTNCSGGPCDFMTAASIAANTTYVAPIPGGRPFPNGISWSASSANAIVGYIRGTASSY